MYRYTFLHEAVGYIATNHVIEIAWLLVKLWLYTLVHIERILISSDDPKFQI